MYSVREKLLEHEKINDKKMEFNVKTLADLIDLSKKRSQVFWGDFKEIKITELNSRDKIITIKFAHHRKEYFVKRVSEE